MYIVQLLEILLFGADVEIMTSRLPECARQIVRHQSQLVFRVALFVASPERDTLLQNLHNNRWILDLRFANQQMNVFRHDNIAGDHELISPSGLFQDVSEKIPPSRGVQKRQPMIAGAGDKVPVTLTVNSNETFRHELFYLPPFAPDHKLADARLSRKGWGTRRYS